MIDSLPSKLALTLSIVIHACIAMIGGTDISPSELKNDTPLEVSVAYLAQSNTGEEGVVATAKKSALRSSLESSHYPETEVRQSDRHITLKDNEFVAASAPIKKPERPEIPVQTGSKSQEDGLRLSEPEHVKKMTGIENPKELLKGSAPAKPAWGNIPPTNSHDNRPNPPAIARAYSGAKNTSKQSAYGNAMQAFNRNSLYNSINRPPAPAKREPASMAEEDTTSTTPLYYRIPKPPYPRQSRAQGEEGTVIIAVLVDTSGNVKEAQIAKSSGFSRLDGSALATVKKKWRFKPGTHNGQPIESRVQVPIKFEISSS